MLLKRTLAGFADPVKTSTRLSRGTGAIESAKLYGLVRALQRLFSYEMVQRTPVNLRLRPHFLGHTVSAFVLA